jgi:hypothetical protein
MNADDEAKRMINEAIAEAWRRLWYELGATELAPGECAQREAIEEPHTERTAAAVECHHDADLIEFFDQLELAQDASRERRRPRELKALLRGEGAGPLLAQPSLAEQRKLPN